jgi:hypothetical protein
MKILRIILHFGYHLQGLVTNLKFWKNIKNLAKWGQFFLLKRNLSIKLSVKSGKDAPEPPVCSHWG